MVTHGCVAGQAQAERTGEGALAGTCNNAAGVLHRYVVACKRYTRRNQTRTIGG